MKRLLIPALSIMAALTPATVAAQQPTFDNNNFYSLFSLKAPKPKGIATLPVIHEPKTNEVSAEQKKPEPVTYTVVEGDTLSSIGTAYNVEWQRLWAKNTQLTDPNIINIGDKITIPLADEQLHRDIPSTASLPTTTPGVTAPTSRAAAGNYGGGNSYDYGYCTWYVKNRRGNTIPNYLGDANTWYSRAAGMGMAVGSAPSAGAVGTTTAGSYGHVVYVESVNNDGTVNISEMNYQGWGVTSYRTTSASEFVYIY